MRVDRGAAAVVLARMTGLQRLRVTVPQDVAELVCAQLTGLKQLQLHTAAA
jgi:hypothetical protein